MTLKAFTNEVGTRSLNEGRINRRYGRYYDKPIDEVISNYTVEVERSIKPASFPCGRGNCSNYTRMAYKVTRDRPRVRYVYSVNPQKDYREIFYVSGDFTPFSFRAGGAGSQNAIDKSRVAALNNLHASSTQLGADLGESHQTIDMLANSASKLGKALIALKRRDWNGFVSALGLDPASIRKSQYRTIANMWLEYAYGWKPLMSSIYDAQQVLRKKIDPNRRITSNGYGKNHEQSSYRSTTGRDVQWSLEQSYKTQLFATVSNPGLLRLNDLGVVNPLSIAWELVPWSFAIDWFIPVGDFLSALTAGVGLNFAGGLTSCHETFVLNLQYPLMVETTGARIIDGGDYSETQFKFSRTCFANFPIPHLYANPNPYSTTRALNALALVRQLC